MQSSVCTLVLAVWCESANSASLQELKDVRQLTAQLADAEQGRRVQQGNHDNEIAKVLNYQQGLCPVSAHTAAAAM